MQKNEVTKKEVAPPPSVFTRTETSSEIDNQDIILPRLLLAQGLSKVVGAEEAQMGDIYNSLTKAKVAGKGQKTVFVPIKVNKYWKVFEKINGQKKFKQIVPFTSANRDWQWEEIRDGKEICNDCCLDIIGFTEPDLKDPSALPSALSFTRTSYKTGQKFTTFLKTMELAGLAYFAKMYSIDSTKMQNDKGIFYVYDVSPVMNGTKHVDTPLDYAEKLKQWSSILASKKVEVDAAEDEVQDMPTQKDSRF